MHISILVPEGVLCTVGMSGWSAVFGFTQPTPCALCQFPKSHHMHTGLAATLPWLVHHYVPTIHLPSTSSNIPHCTCTCSKPSCTPTFGCAHPSMFPIAWRNFHHKPALVAPFILWLEYLLCAHHTHFPIFQLPGTHVDLPFCQPGPFMAWAPPHTPFCAPSCTPAHLCASPFLGLSPLSDFPLTSDPLPATTGNPALVQLGTAPIPDLCITKSNPCGPHVAHLPSLWACTTHIAIQGSGPARSPVAKAAPIFHCSKPCNRLANYSMPWPMGREILPSGQDSNCHP